ncbi:MAG: subtilisin [Bacteroidetes bacterium]|nr:MAG: subtilisin [Bacteroidota bacterium]
MEFIYSYAYIGILVSTVLWLFLKNKEMPTTFVSGGFLVSVLTYVLTLLLDDGSLIFKFLWLLPRDLSLFVLIVLFFNKFVKMPKVFYVGLAVVFMFFKFFYLDKVLMTSFNSPTFFEQYFTKPSEQKRTSKQEIQFIGNKLDPNAEVLIDVKNPNDVSAIEKALIPYKSTIQKAFPNLQHPEYSELDDYYTVNIPEDADLGDIFDVLTQTNQVDWIEENEMYQLNLPKVQNPSPTPPKIDYGINDPDLSKLWAFEQMKVADLYAQIRKQNIQPVRKAKIAILDTGIDFEHEDLNGNYISTNKEYDSDKQGHGTHCAGIAAAVSNNGKGIASFAPNNQFVQVTSIKVLSDEGWGTQKDILEGIILAADQKADVISMSLGGPSNDLSQKAYEEAVKYANRAGAIMVVAAGNSNENAIDFSPANVKGVIAVTAVDHNLKKAEFSNFITDLEMGLAAPGVAIFSTFPENSYMELNGTSMATPYVAGLLGIMKSVTPDLTTKQAFDILNLKGIDTDNTKATGKFVQANVF